MRIKELLLIIVLLFLSSFVYSDQFSIFLENDVVYGQTDHFYTHGTRLQYNVDGNDSENYGFAIGQNIYTPDDKASTVLIPNDRPYAGWLYGSAFDTVYNQLLTRDQFHNELQVGMVGPDSYAEQVQTEFHKIIGSDLPMGWDNQVYNHFGVLLMSKYTVPAYENSYCAIDPYVGTSVGNLSDCIDTGFNAYIGYNLPANRSEQRVITFKAIRNEGWKPYAYMYFGLEPKFMMYNMMLEDPRFSIHPESFVYDRNLGWVVGCTQFEVAFTLCFRSREFEEQLQQERFGSVKLTFAF